MRAEWGRGQVTNCGRGLEGPGGLVVEEEMGREPRGRERLK
jgi:hypothetical protein